MTTQYLSSIGLAVANHLWQSTAFAVAAWLLSLLLRTNRAKIRFGLWLTASMKFLIPFSLLIGLGGLLPRTQHVIARSQTAVYSAIDVVGQPFSSFSPEVVPVAQHASLKQSFLNALPAILLLIWLCGSVTVFLLSVGRWRQVSATLRRAAAAQTGREVELLRRVEQAMGVRRPVPLRLSREMMEPGIFGIFRPGLIWPEQLSERLEDEHIEVILAHELMHVQRHDNLASTMHMAVEVAFWFHPLAWLMEQQMAEERERACDEAVVEMGRRPGIYADSLLKACRFCIEAPPPRVSGVTGGDLKKRIVHIMARRAKVKLDLSRKLLLIAAGLMTITVPVLSGFAHATQDHAESQADDGAAKLPAFEVSTVKPMNSADGRMRIMLTPDGVSYTGVPLQELLRDAFGVEDDRILGAPSWVKTDRLEIEAKVSASDVPKLKDLKYDQRRQMLAPLLADRFNLKFHHESKELSTYALIISKGGLKLKEAKPGDKYLNGLKGPNGPGGPHMLMIGPGQLTGQGIDIAHLLNALSDQGIDRTIFDKTGLTGEYDFTLQWKPEDASAPMSGGLGGSPPGNGGTTASDSGPSLFTALQEQLGLKLEPQKGPVDVIVVDHIERPSPN